MKARDPVYRNAWNVWCYAKSIKRIPPWVNFARDLLPLYRKLHEEYGDGFVLDHIVPLKGKEVSGLHVPKNLQVMAFGDNSSKGRSFCENLLRFYD